ncbi:MAG: M20 family metallopeptidase [Intrasporangium sp.]|uniref:M20 metallopeptidase family protein n=1 Tax=Intrasporangium sp. TaxID=1925024 RepID=UPI0026487BEA|nr:M20 family metallopeptidase [Intrasporangium sp.]MDN5797034.1 M20 family metallopeptidase [Intrasporangium sp.]
MSLRDDATSMADELVQLRHELHQEPEIGLTLPKTQARVLAALDGLPLEVSTGTRTTSVTAVLRGTGRAGTQSETPTVLLRGDMDALPVTERADVPYRSRIDGAMHACGHDLHTTMLIGAARLLAAHRDQLEGDVVLMFQPGEEGWDGAGVMIEEGVLDAAGRRADAAFGLHVFSAVAPHGAFLTRPGTMMSASDELRATVQGAGGHGSTPHRAKDPVPAVAEVVMALQAMVTRQFDIFDPVVVTVGQLHAGTTSNVIPDDAYLEATVRTFSEESQERMAEAAPRLVRQVAAAHGLEASVEYLRSYPVTVNDVDETAFAAKTVAEVFGPARQVDLAAPLGGSEDFSRVLQNVPGSFLFLGAVPPGQDPATAPMNHSPLATFDDSVLPDGATLYAELAVRRLAQLAATR